MAARRPRTSPRSTDVQGQKPPTSAESERLGALKELWCLPCAMDNWDGVPPDVQHVLSGKYRIGHHATYPACKWHHQAEPPPGLTIDDATARYGPSFALEKRRYEEVYAPERDLILIADIALLRKQIEEANGNVFTEEMYGELVRHEAAQRFNRGVAISR